MPTTTEYPADPDQPRRAHERAALAATPHPYRDTPWGWPLCPRLGPLKRRARYTKKYWRTVGPAKQSRPQAWLAASATRQARDWELLAPYLPATPRWLATGPEPHGPE